MTTINKIRQEPYSGYAAAPFSSPRFMTVLQFCDYLGFSRATFYRRLKDLGEKPPGRLLSPQTQKRLCALLDYPYMPD